MLISHYWPPERRRENADRNVDGRIICLAGLKRASGFAKQGFVRVGRTQVGYRHIQMSQAQCRCNLLQCVSQEAGDCSNAAGHGLQICGLPSLAGDWPAALTCQYTQQDDTGTCMQSMVWGKGQFAGFLPQTTLFI